MEFLRSLCEINDKGGTDLNCWLCKSICYSTERSLGYKKKDFTWSLRFFYEINDKGDRYKLSVVQKHPFHRKISRIQENKNLQGF